MGALWRSQVLTRMATPTQPSKYTSSRQRRSRQGGPHQIKRLSPHPFTLGSMSYQTVESFIPEVRPVRIFSTPQPKPGQPTLQRPFSDWIALMEPPFYYRCFPTIIIRPITTLRE